MIWDAHAFHLHQRPFKTELLGTWKSLLQCWPLWSDDNQMTLRTAPAILQKGSGSRRTDDEPQRRNFSNHHILCPSHWLYSPVQHCSLHWCKDNQSLATHSGLACHEWIRNINTWITFALSAKNGVAYGWFCTSVHKKNGLLTHFPGSMNSAQATSCSIWVEEQLLWQVSSYWTMNLQVIQFLKPNKEAVDLDTGRYNYRINFIAFSKDWKGSGQGRNET